MAVRWWAAGAGLGPGGGSPSERTTAPGSTVGRTLRSVGGPSVGRPQKSAPPVRRRPPEEDDDDRPVWGWFWPEPWRFRLRRLRFPPLPVLGPSALMRSPARHSRRPVAGAAAA